MTAVLDNQTILQKLQERFSDDILHSEEQYGILCMTTTKDAVLPILKNLYEDADLKFNFLTDICGLHYPDQELQLGVAYQLHSLKHNIRLRIKAFLPVDNPRIPSATALYKAANWMERETYDFFGIIFEGHPDLRRILNVDDMVVFPMRKEYPLEDPNRKDKHDEYFGR